MGKLSIQLKPEPDNLYDTNAVAFVCQTDEDAKWKRISCVVREAASEVLIVINNKNYLSNFCGSSFFLTLRTEVGMLG